MEHLKRASSKTTTAFSEESPKQKKPMFSCRYAAICAHQGKPIAKIEAKSSHAPLAERLHFVTDTYSYEAIRSAGLSIQVIQKGFMRSYHTLYLSSWKDAVSYSQDKFNFDDWLKSKEFMRLKKGNEDFTVNFPYYILELTVSSKDTLFSHLENKGKNPSQITGLKNGSTIGYLAFDEHAKDSDWIDIRSLYIIPCAQSLGFGTMLIKCISGLAMSYKKKGVEFNNPFSLPNSASFYKWREVKLIFSGASVRHMEGCAQLEIFNNDGSLVHHPLLPKSSIRPLVFKRIPAADARGLCD